MAFSLSDLVSGIGRGVLGVGTLGMSEMARSGNAQVGETLAKFQGADPATQVSELMKLGSPQAAQMAEQIMSRPQAELPTAVREAQVLMQANPQLTIEDAMARAKGQPTASERTMKQEQDAARLGNETERVALDRQKRAEEAAKVAKDSKLTKASDIYVTRKFIQDVGGTIELARKAKELVMKNPQLAGITGFAAGMVPGTDAYNYAETLETIKSRVGLGKLSEMKNDSATGASGLGQQTVREMESLQSFLGSLKQGQSAEQLISNFDNMEKGLAESTKNIRSKFDATYPELAQSGRAQGRAAPQVGPQQGQGSDQVAAPVAAAPLKGLTTLPAGFKKLGNGMVQGPDGKKYKVKRD